MRYFAFNLFVLFFAGNYALAQDATRNADGSTTSKATINLQADEIERLRAENAGLRERIRQLEANHAASQPTTRGGKGRAMASLPATAALQKVRAPTSQPTKPPKLIYKFTDEKTLKRDWTTTEKWRIEGDGLRLIEVGSGVTSKVKFEGDITLVIPYQKKGVNLSVSMWGEEFVFAGEAASIARLQRKGDTVLFAAGNEHPKTVKLKEEESNRSSAITIVVAPLHVTEYRSILIPYVEVTGRSVPVEVEDTPKW